jgi:hypothetical protein
MKPLTISLGPEAQLIVTVPSPMSALTHDIAIPLSVGGLRLLVKLLSERRKADDLRIGTQASPIQEQIDHWLRMDRAETRAKPVLADLELTLEDINLDL